MHVSQNKPSLLLGMYTSHWFALVVDIWVTGGFKIDVKACRVFLPLGPISCLPRDFGVIRNSCSLQMLAYGCFSTSQTACL